MLIHCKLVQLSQDTRIAVAGTRTYSNIFVIDRNVFTANSFLFFNLLCSDDLSLLNIRNLPRRNLPLPVELNEAVEGFQLRAANETIGRVAWIDELLEPLNDGVGIEWERGRLAAI